jgi:hypothetical protein
MSLIAASLSSVGTPSAVPSASLTPLANPARGFVTSGLSIFEKSLAGWVGC